jgi:two-component system CheB/CheR fusion protein
MLLDEVGRASRITKQTLAYYRESKAASPVNLPELLDSVLELHNPALMKKNISLRRSYRDSTAAVDGFGSELRQVFANLILNAVDAMPWNGELHIRVDSGRRGEVRVTIADNGCGIPPEGRARLFEPFFTTKIGRGNGLGLWVSAGIVRKHSGRIRFRSSTVPGRSGSVFTVILPRAAQGKVSRAA